MFAEANAPPGHSSAEIAHEWWRRLSAFDFVGAGELLAPDVVVEWPVSNERFRGRETVVAINEAYPGRWRATIVQSVAAGDRCVVEANVTDGQETDVAVSFFTIHNGLIQTLREFWPEPYPAPAWRKRWADVEEESTR